MGHIINTYTVPTGPTAEASAPSGGEAALRWEVERLQFALDMERGSLVERFLTDREAADEVAALFRRAGWRPPEAPTPKLCEHCLSVNQPPGRDHAPAVARKWFL